jgi:hypothetical protein
VNTPRSIYVASSWRNRLQPEIVQTLRRLGHQVYDFRNPTEGNKGFSWSEIDSNWKYWTSEEYRDALTHPIAKEGYRLDIKAVRSCDTAVLVLPSGRSASWEFGYMMGQGKPGYVVMFEPCEPELMYSEAQILVTSDELIQAFTVPEPPKPTHMALVGPYGDVYIKEYEYFVSQGGLRKAWGRRWHRISVRGVFENESDEIEAARKLACETLPGAKPYRDLR